MQQRKKSEVKKTIDGEFVILCNKRQKKCREKAVKSGTVKNIFQINKILSSCYCIILKLIRSLLTIIFFIINEQSAFPFYISKKKKGQKALYSFCSCIIFIQL